MPGADAWQFVPPPIRRYRFSTLILARRSSQLTTTGESTVWLGVLQVIRWRQHALTGASISGTPLPESDVVLSQCISLRLNTRASATAESWLPALGAMDNSCY